MEILFTSCNRILRVNEKKYICLNTLDSTYIFNLEILIIQKRAQFLIVILGTFLPVLEIY